MLRYMEGIWKKVYGIKNISNMPICYLKIIYIKAGG